MGFMDLFNRGPLSEKKIEKITKLACNPFAQPDVREMQRLLAEGTPTALRAALKRFAANAHGGIADEEEKEWLTEKLLALGEPIVEPLEHYIQSQKQLSHALQTYEQLVGKDAATEFLLGTLEKFGPESHREDEAKKQIILHLAEGLDRLDELERLAPFLFDHSDDVRWTVLDIFEQWVERGLLADKEVMKTWSKQFADLVVDPYTAPRILNKVLSIVENGEIRFEGAAVILPDSLEDTFFIDKKGYLRRRVKSVKQSGKK